MIAQTRLIRLLATRRQQQQLLRSTSSQFNYTFSSSSTNEGIITSDQVSKEEKYQELCFKFEREWSKVQRETEDKQRQVMDEELTELQQKRVKFLADSMLQMNIMEVRYFNHSLKNRMIKTTGISPISVNIDWPSIKQLENGTWPPANPNWMMQQEAIARLWPLGQAGIAQLFGSMMGSAGSSTSAEAAANAATAAAAAAAEAKPVEEAPKEKLNYDVELTGFDPAVKIKIIKEVRALFNLGLKEAKEMVEKTPCVLKAGCKKAEAEELKEKLIALGCTVNLL